MSQRTVTLHFSDSDRTIELPVLEGTMGPDVIDTRSLVFPFYLMTEETV